MAHILQVIIVGIIGLIVGLLLKKTPQAWQPLIEAILQGAMAEVEAWAAKTSEKVTGEIKKQKAVEIALEKLETLREYGIKVEVDPEEIAEQIQEIFDSYYGKILNGLK